MSLAFLYIEIERDWKKCKGKTSNKKTIYDICICTLRCCCCCYSFYTHSLHFRMIRTSILELSTCNNMHQSKCYLLHVLHSPQLQMISKIATLIHFFLHAAHLRFSQFLCLSLSLSLTSSTFFAFTQLVCTRATSNTISPFSDSITVPFLTIFREIVSEISFTCAPYSGDFK